MENLFLNEYFSELKEYNSIPKLQIERAVSPILSIFIEVLITDFLKDNPELSGNIELILPEFPFKKLEGNQSTNIDWLMINKQKGYLFFIELKTAASSFKQEQLQEYKTIKNFIKKFTAKFLFEEVAIIRDKSNEQKKYDFILKKLAAYEKYFHQITNSEIIYIAPTSVKQKIKDVPVIAFSDFPADLNHTFSKEWQQLRSFFQSIDKISYNPISINTGDLSNSDSELENKLKIIHRKSNKTPEFIWFGTTGEGTAPNFQIKFTDGSIQPFYSSGKEYSRAREFHSKNLKGPYIIKDILKNY